MTVLVKVFTQAKQAESSQTTQYTAVNCRAIIDKFTATNTSASNVTFSVNLVANAETAVTGNLIVQAKTIPPGKTHVLTEVIGHSLESGGFISTLASAASSITIRISGREIT